MKKSYAIIAFAAIAVLSCTKNEVIPSPDTEQAEDYVFTLTASVDPELTKTSYANEKTFSWSAYDKISVVFHNSDGDHKFFDLTTTSGGTEATFSGTITAGYTVGASEAQGGAIWALFPAGAHTWNTSTNRPVFDIPAVTDFTTGDHAHFSANIPMAFKGTSASNIVFKHISSPYKISFKNLEVNKVRLTVRQSVTHKLSGSFTMEDSSSNPGLWAQHADAGSAEQAVSYVVNVGSDKKASFYFSIPRYGETTGFQPTITLYDESTDYIIYQSTAKTDWITGTDTNLKPSYDKMVVLPTISATGTGSPLISRFGVNWSSLDMYPSDPDKEAYDGASSPEYLKEWKASSDASNIYFLFKIAKSKITANDSGEYHWQTYLVTGYDLGNTTNNDGSAGYSLGEGFDARSTIFCFTGNTSSGLQIVQGTESNSELYYDYPFGSTNLSASKASCGGNIVGDYAYIEVAIPRAAIGATSLETITVKHSYREYVTERQEISLYTTPTE